MRVLVAAECVLLFVLLPTLLALIPDLVPGIPLLWFVAGYCMYILKRDVSFDTGCLWRWCGLRSELPAMAAMFAAATLVIGLIVRYYQPAALLDLPRRSLLTWGLLIAAYPVLSVYPQTVIFRAFFFHRYRPLFGNGFGLLIAGAIAFAYLHIIFRNPVAVAATVPAGIAFGKTYLDTRSAAISWLQHTLYGCMIFTIGLGRYFGQVSHL